MPMSSIFQAVLLIRYRRLSAGKEHGERLRLERTFLGIVTLPVRSEPASATVLVNMIERCAHVNACVKARVMSSHGSPTSWPLGRPPRTQHYSDTKRSAHRA